MKVTKESLEDQKVVLTIEVPAEELAKAKAKACKNLANRMNIPGFRKGKAPAMIVERHAGKEVVLEEAFEEIYPQALKDAYEQENVEPVTRPEMDVVTLEEGKDVVFKASFTKRPEVKLGEYKNLKIEKEAVVVTDEDVDHQIEHMREHHGKMVDAPEGAAVQDGDFTTLDFKGFVDDEPFAGGEGKDYPLQIGSGSFIPGFEEQLIGAKIGEEVEVKVTFPEDYHAAELAGKDAVFKCTVHSIRQKELPPVDDALAQKVSKFQTLDELKADIRKGLQENAERKAESDRRAAALEKAAQNAEMEIPAVMIDNRVSTMIRDMAMRLQQQGMTLEQYLQYSGTDIEKIRADYREPAEKNVRTDLMLEEVVKAEEIKLEPEDLDREIAGMAAAYGVKPNEVKKVIREQNRFADLAVTILHRKAANFIVENITE